jgi:hypothetical protein
MSILTTQISRSEAAQLIGKTPRWINKLEVAGFIKKTERGKYLAADVAQGYAQSLIVDRRSTTQSVAQTQLTEARTVLLKQRNERESGKWLEQAVNEIFKPSLLAFARSLDGVPAAFTRDLRERRKLEDLLGDARNAALKKLDEASK